MKKVWTLILTSILLMTCIGCGKLNLNNPVDTNSDAYQFKQDYESYNEEENAIVVNIDSNNPIKYATVDETFQLLEEKTGILYLGFPTCPWCRNMIESLIAAAKEEDIEQIYYFNPRTVKAEQPEQYDNLKMMLSDYLATNADGEKTLYVPDVYFIKDGTIIGHHLGTLETQQDPYVILTETEKEQLKNIYIDYIKQIK